MENCFICNSEPEKVIVSGAEMYHCPNCDPEAKLPVLPEKWDDFVRGQAYVKSMEDKITRLSDLIERFTDELALKLKIFLAFALASAIIIALSFFDVKPLSFSIIGTAMFLMSVFSIFS